METEKESKESKSNRQRETLFRVTYANQTSLRQIVDNKANIIISINTVVISSIIAISGYGMMAKSIDLYQSDVVIPLVIILFSCLTSAVYAVLAALPKIIKSNILTAPMEKQSLLFFGIISDFSQTEYLKKMEVLLKSRKSIYEQMIIDIHSQGIVLKRKFNLLTYAYLVLMYGFGLGVISFVLLIYFGQSSPEG